MKAINKNHFCDYLQTTKSESIDFVLLDTTFYPYFHGRVALLKHNFLKDPCTES